MQRIATREEMQQIDSFSIEQCKIPGIVLMEKAAMAMEEEIISRFPVTTKILIVTEKGNNGGDGLALARLLLHRGYLVDVYEIGEIDHATASYETQRRILESLDVRICRKWPYKHYDVIVDAIFGVGLKRAVMGEHAKAILRMNDMTGFKIALDIPSGVDASTGNVLGTGFRADLTITVGLNKVGLLLYPGAEYAGEIVVKDIGFPQKAVEEIGTGAVSYTKEDLSRLTQRKAWSNKGTYGRVLLIAGSYNMAGAAYLSGLAAYRAGAGLVRIFTCEENRQILQTKLPDAILTTYTGEKDAIRKLEEAVTWANVIGFGPGLGTDHTGEAMFEQVLRQAKVPLILDADGLNILAKLQNEREGNEKAEEICNLFACYQAGVVMTPHMKEMERLSKIPVKTLIEDRIARAKEQAGEKHILVLKDARTIVTDGVRETYINTSGNHGMAVGGSGDVLTGIIAAFAVQNDLLEAARLGVYCHGLAGDAAVKKAGYHGLMASDIANHILLEK